MPCVVQPWMNDLTFKQQSVILSALRGCDGKEKHDCTKRIVRALRGIVLYDADPDSTFIRRESLSLAEAVAEFSGDLDHYPMHFVLHLMFAAEIVGYEHPDRDTRHDWAAFYFKTVHAMHLNPETPEEMRARLTDKIRGDEYGRIGVSADPHNIGR